MMPAEGSAIPPFPSRFTIFSFLFILLFPCALPADDAGKAIHKGLVLPLYAADADFDYEFALREIAAAGANSVSLTVVLLQDNGASTRIDAKPGRTVPDDALRRTIRQARAAGLAVMLFPVVLLEYPRGNDWRGNLKPVSITEWFANYRHWLAHYATIAREEQCAWFSIGSEYSSLEENTDEWRRVISEAREQFPGKLLYSCNWDHLDGPAAWWTSLDAVGLSSYYELTKDKDAPQEELDSAWRKWRDDVLDWRVRNAPAMPIIFTEVGYPSMDGAAVYPWDYTLPNEPDFDEQRRCYQAFISAWDNRPEIEGVYFYKWLSFDADDTKGYSPRGKPAEAILRHWFEEVEKQ